MGLNVFKFVNRVIWPKIGHYKYYFFNKITLLGQSFVFFSVLLNSCNMGWKARKLWQFKIWSAKYCTWCAFCPDFKSQYFSRHWQITYFYIKISVLTCSLSKKCLVCILCKEKPFWQLIRLADFAVGWYVNFSLKQNWPGLFDKLFGKKVP